MWLLHCGDLWELWRKNALWLAAQLSVGPTFAVGVFRVSSLLAASETVIFQPSSGVFLPAEPTKNHHNRHTIIIIVVATFAI
jgi:hypothetical protein